MTVRKGQVGTPGKVATDVLLSDDRSTHVSTLLPVAHMATHLVTWMGGTGCNKPVVAICCLGLGTSARMSESEGVLPYWKYLWEHHDHPVASSVSLGHVFI